MWEPLGPQGGCVGGAMQITVAFTDCCPDEPADGVPVTRRPGG
jgi:hypothetical protein